MEVGIFDLDLWPWNEWQHASVCCPGALCNCCLYDTVSSVCRSGVCMCCSCRRSSPASLSSSNCFCSRYLANLLQCSLVM